MSRDFNGHSKLWWKDGGTSAEGSEIDQLPSRLGLKLWWKDGGTSAEGSEIDQLPSRLGLKLWWKDGGTSAEGSEIDQLPSRLGLKLWWKDGGTSTEGSEIDQLPSRLGLNQLIKYPTNVEPHRNPSCFDFIFTDQPNLVIESRTRPILDNFCYHQITYCRMQLSSNLPLLHLIEIWQLSRANIPLICRTISNISWMVHLNLNPDP